MAIPRDHEGCVLVEYGSHGAGERKADGAGVKTREARKTQADSLSTAATGNL